MVFETHTAVILDFNLALCCSISYPRLPILLIKYP